MALTKRQLKEIEDLINRRFLSFTFEALGEEALSESEVALLRRKGLLRPGTRHMTGDAYTLGKIAALVDRRSMRSVSYDEVLRAAKRMVPRTSVEKRAMQHAAEHAGIYIKGLRDSMLRDVSAVATRHRGAAVRRVGEVVSEAIGERKTISELKSDLFHSFENHNRDWQRVAHTEINTSIQQGIYQEIKEKSDEGAEQLVYKSPNPDACQHCKRVYLRADGITPKVFKLSELHETNVGRKARNWLPTIGSVHPWCNCQLQVIPDGFDFVKKKVFVTGPKRGEVVFDEELAKMSEEQKSKLGVNAILSYTGETAKPVKKSEIFRAISDEAGNEPCEHV